MLRPGLQHVRVKFHDSRALQSWLSARWSSAMILFLGSLVLRSALKRRRKPADPHVGTGSSVARASPHSPEAGGKHTCKVRLYYLPSERSLVPCVFQALSLLRLPGIRTASERVPNSNRIVEPARRALLRGGFKRTFVAPTLQTLHRGQASAELARRSAYMAQHSRGTCVWRAGPVRAAARMPRSLARRRARGPRARQGIGAAAEYAATHIVCCYTRAP